jgi:hypothetical protein
MKTKTICVRLVGLALVTTAAPATVADDESTGDQIVTDDPQKQEIIEEVKHRNHGEIPDKVDVTFSDGTQQTLEFETVIEDMILNTVPSEERAGHGFDDAAVAAGPTPSSCHPAIIYSVVDLSGGGPASDMELSGQDVPAPGYNIQCGVFGAQTVSGPAQGSVSNADASFVEVGFVNTQTSWQPSGQDAIYGLDSGEATGECGLLLEFSFLGISIQQLGIGMPGCGANSAVGTISAS